LKRAATIVIITISLLAILTTIGLAVVLGMGWKIGTVVSGSMEPDLGVGQVALAKPLDPAEIEIGDIIAFKSPEDPESIITHRVIEVVDAEDDLLFQTKGDANTRPDEFLVPAENVEGKIVFHVPYIGHLLRFFQTGQGLIVLLAVAMILLSFGWMALVYSRAMKIQRQPSARPNTLD
jgi:signal peptidase